MTLTDFRTEAQAMADELVARRRDLHRHPELGFEEYRTAGIVADELRRLGLEVQTGIGKTGVVGLLPGAHDGPTVLLRADMDALPVTEENETDYTSAATGRMHACGHDGHTTILLGVARLLAARRDRMAGRVKFVFQPAEEIGTGAKAMIADGVLRDPAPDVTIGLHLWNSLPSGVLGVADGPMMAGASTFDIVLKGKGGHAALPHLVIDPVVCGAHVIAALQTVVTRSLDPLEGGVISVTWLQAGEAYNVIPQRALLRGTMRFFRIEVRDMMEARMSEIVQHVAAAFGCAGSITFDRQMDPVINDPDVGGRLREVFARIVGPDRLDTTVRTMAAEDVSFLMGNIPGMYFFLGARDEGQDEYYGHHHPRFCFDEGALPLGVTLLSEAAAAYVLPGEA